MADERLRDGRYAIVGKLGEGSQGTTFDGVDVLRGKPVAIKRFSVKGAASWKDVELAEREAAVLAALAHPSLPAHVEHFEEGGALYLVMEKIEGESLAALVKRAGALGRDDVLAFLRDMGGVLEYLHGRSPPVIHRDINPKNVLRRPDGTFAIVDFGAVRDRLKPDGGSTVVGTYGYMAPEQFQGRALPASDVYAVGATAIRMLTGVDPEELPHRGLAIDVARALGTNRDPKMTRALERMLDPDPDRRASSLAPILKELERRPPETERTRVRDAARDAVPDAARATARERTRVKVEFTTESRSERRRKAREEYREFKRRTRRDRGPGRRPRGPPLAFLLLGLSMAIMVVGIVLGFAVPLFLTILSIFFGSALRDAARRVRDAGQRARTSMREAQRYLLYGPGPTPGSSPSVRVEDEPAEAPRVRADGAGGPDVIDVEGEDATEADPRARRL